MVCFIMLIWAYSYINSVQVARSLHSLATWLPIASISATTLQSRPLLMCDILYQRNCTVELLIRNPPCSANCIRYQLLFPDCTRFSLLIPDCVHFSFCSPTASSSAAAPQVRPLVITHTQYKVRRSLYCSPTHRTSHFRYARTDRHLKS